MVSTMSNLPKSNAQAPNSLHLIAGGLASANPVTVEDVTSLIVNGALQLTVQLSSRFGNAIRADDLAVQIG